MPFLERPAKSRWQYILLELSFVVEKLLCHLSLCILPFSLICNTTLSYSGKYDTLLQSGLESESSKEHKSHNLVPVTTEPSKVAPRYLCI